MTGLLPPVMAGLLPPVMAGEGRPSTSFLALTSKDVDGGAKEDVIQSPIRLARKQNGHVRLILTGSRFARSTTSRENRLLLDPTFARLPAKSRSWIGLHPRTRGIHGPPIHVFTPSGKSWLAGTWPLLSGSVPWLELALLPVMAGLGPPIHAFIGKAEDVDGRRGGRP